MKLEHLEHLLRAAAMIADDDELIVVGSQAVLGQFPDAPEELLVSVEADLYPKNHPERWELIDGSLGELSPFHQAFGYYAQGVAPGTAVLPNGWESRLVALSSPRTRGARGFCLEIHDLLASKYVANRDKDRRFARDAFHFGLAQPTIVHERVGLLDIAEEQKSRIADAIRIDARHVPRAP